MSQLDAYDVDPAFGCWLWTGRTDSRDGRGLVWRGGKPFGAYLAMYQQHVGTVADGLVLDHLCRRASCVRPTHLEPVTQSENELRKAWRYRVRRATCARGHDLRVNRMVTPEGGILCRICMVDAMTPG